MENWKDIPGYEGLYQISDLGRVKSFVRKEPKILKPVINPKSGYHTYALKGGKSFSAHVLMGITFLNHVPVGRQGFVVDHINNIKGDNRLCNLQIISHRDNLTKDKTNKSGYPTGVNKTPSGRYRAGLRINSKGIHIGTFDTPEQAHQAYLNKIKELPNG